MKSRNLSEEKKNNRAQIFRYFRYESRKNNIIPNDLILSQPNAISNYSICLLTDEYEYAVV